VVYALDALGVSGRSRQTGFVEAVAESIL